MNLRIAKKIARFQYGAHVYTPDQRTRARRRYLRHLERGKRYPSADRFTQPIPDLRRERDTSS